MLLSSIIDTRLPGRIACTGENFPFSGTPLVGVARRKWSRLSPVLRLPVTSRILWGLSTHQERLSTHFELMVPVPYVGWLLNVSGKWVWRFEIDDGCLET